MEGYDIKKGWSTPFDNVGNESPDSNLPVQESQVPEIESVDAQAVTDGYVAASQEAAKETSLPEVASYLNTASNALFAVDDLVTKGYLEKLGKMDVLDPGTLNEDDVVMFKIDLMAYEKDEYATDKFVSVFSAMTYTVNTVFLIVDGHPDHTDFYLGIKNDDDNLTTSSVASTFESSIRGQFPGIKLKNLSNKQKNEDYSPQHRVLRELKYANNISSYVGVPSLKGDGQYTNVNYIQGIEKFATAMYGKRYTAIVIARNQMPSTTAQMRNAYENIYSQLSCMAQQQLAYSTNESIAHALTRSQGKTETTSHSVSDGTSENKSTNQSHSESKSKGENWSEGESKPNLWSKGSQLAGPLMEAGAILSMTGVGAPVGGAVMGVGALLGLGGIVGGKSKSKSTGGSESESVSDSTSQGESRGKTHNETDSQSHGETITDSEGNTSTIGSSKNFTLTLHNKRVEDILKKIDKQLERIDAAESNGLWSTATYFLSFDNDNASAQTGASIFRSIVQGDKSNVETSAINTWKINKADTADADKENAPIPNDVKLCRSISALTHPVFRYANEFNQDIEVEGSSLLSTKELAMIMGLPRKSVPGLPVIEHISLGKEIVKANGQAGSEGVDLGIIYDQGVEHSQNPVRLNVKSLTQHVFITGSTGSGKSETVYRLMDEVSKTGATYLVIEPAKGEYKSVFGQANVFGSNPLVTPLIRINPFGFPKGIHVLEHIDRLVEIFNVCWPMYAAMPAVLKKAVLRAYEQCGWNLYKSVNKTGTDIFPSFVDLLMELESAINESAYSEEVKGNYIGSLVTRVESLTNGINGEIFSSNEISDDVLFDQNTIIDLSRIGAQETKSLIMGILIMRLNEHRMVKANKANAGLRHLTILEEAHNILKRTSTEQSMEGSNVAGKSVEMLINSIAEMRTYGEGFVIVDQSPTSVHAAAIKNTNTKIIMRLPDGDDRRIAGKSAALRDDQVDEIAKLPTGVAIIYQNDWLQPVMGKITMANIERCPYQENPDAQQVDDTEIPLTEILKLLLKGRLSRQEEPDLVAIESGLVKGKIPTSTKIRILSLVKEYRETGKLTIWDNDNFVELSKLIVKLTGLSQKVLDIAAKASSFDELNSILTSLLSETQFVPDYMNLTLRQVLMRDYAERGTSELKIYNAWLNDIKSKMQ